MGKAAMKPIKIGGKRVAYAVTDDGTSDKPWTVGLATEGEPGYRPVATYGPYANETDADGVVGRLNTMIGLTTKEALVIVASSMRGPGAIRSR